MRTVVIQIEEVSSVSGAPATSAGGSRGQRVAERGHTKNK